jgi:polar amino acid transport system substrate-binding protein
MKKLILGTAHPALTSGLRRDGRNRAHGHRRRLPSVQLHQRRGRVDGFERELGDELCARAELTCEWVKNDWDSIIPNLVSGNYDVIIAGMSITDERDEVIDFTQNYIPPDPPPMSAWRPID